jgi:hypothetical protein
MQYVERVFANKVLLQAHAAADLLSVQQFVTILGSSWCFFPLVCNDEPALAEWQVFQEVEGALPTLEM